MSIYGHLLTESVINESLLSKFVNKLKGSNDKRSKSTVKKESNIKKEKKQNFTVVEKKVISEKRKALAKEILNASKPYISKLNKGCESAFSICSLDEMINEDFYMTKWYYKKDNGSIDIPFENYVCIICGDWNDISGIPDTKSECADDSKCQAYWKAQDNCTSILRELGNKYGKIEFDGEYDQCAIYVKVKSDLLSNDPIFDELKEK